MSLIADIRAQMALESGPVHPKHLAEVLDQDLATVRNTMNQASTKGHGIERLDDGTFSLIPGWKPARGPNAAAESAEAPTPLKKPAKVKAAKQKPAAAKKVAKAKRAYVKRAKAEKAEPQKRTYLRRKNAEFAPVEATPFARPEVHSKEGVFFSRTSLALLVEGVLDGNAPITGALRVALREATSHALPF
jgi:hypothetical protein